MHHDDNTGGLLIVRAPAPETSNSQPAPSYTTDSQPPRFASQSYADAPGPSKPPAKKFRADLQPLRTDSKSKSAQRDRVASSRDYNDSDVEKDVRAMEDEADNLRRKSRAHATINTAVLGGEANIQFSSRSEDQASRSKGKAKATDADDIVERENAQMERNRQMRQGSVDVGGRGRTTDSTSSNGHRRKSSVGGRGKRTSTAFETSGIISESSQVSTTGRTFLSKIPAQPHNSVSESSFYKHIDYDLPDPERIRQLLIWCSLRAVASPPTPSTSRPSSPVPPPLSAQGTEALKSLQDDLVRMLAEKRVDLSQQSPDPGSSQAPREDLRENEQNVRNRHLEIAYSQHVQQ